MEVILSLSFRKCLKVGHFVDPLSDIFVQRQIPCKGTGLKKTHLLKGWTILEEQRKFQVIVCFIFIWGLSLDSQWVKKVHLYFRSFEGSISIHF